jgi:hypothetical protein
MQIKTKMIISQSVFALAVLNFAVFWVLAVYLAQNGHFYLMSHGQYTEVTERVFNYSRWHVYSLWFTHPLAFIAGYWYYRLQRGNESAYRS